MLCLYAQRLSIEGYSGDGVVRAALSPSRVLNYLDGLVFMLLCVTKDEYTLALSKTFQRPCDDID